MGIPTFKELVPQSEVFDGDKIAIEKVIDKPIIIIGFKIKPSKKNNGMCCYINFYFKDDENQTHYVLFTGSAVIKDQLEQVENARKTSSFMEFETTIKKVTNYYSLD